MSRKPIKFGLFSFPASVDENFRDIEENFAELYAADEVVEARVAGIFSILGTGTVAAIGSCAVAFELQDEAGYALTSIQSGLGYVSDVDGNMVTAVTSIETLTDGTISTLITGQLFHWITKSDGTLGLTLTADAETYYITLVRADGTIVVSDPIVVLPVAWVSDGTYTDVVFESYAVGAKDDNGSTTEYVK